MFVCLWADVTAIFEAWSHSLRIRKRRIEARICNEEPWTMECIIFEREAASGECCQRSFDLKCVLLSYLWHCLWSHAHRVNSNVCKHMNTVSAFLCLHLNLHQNNLLYQHGLNCSAVSATLIWKLLAAVTLYVSDDTELFPIFLMRITWLSDTTCIRCVRLDGLKE